MIWIGAAMALVVLIQVASLLWRRSPKPPLDPAAVMQAAVELHRIRRDLDVAYTKSEQRRDSAQLRRDIGDAMDGSDGA